MRHERESGKACPCGSGHDWELGKHGWCECSDRRCDRVHRAEEGTQ